MPRRRPPGPLAAVALLLLLPAGPAAAQDEPIELADDPFEITDPIAARPGEVELSIAGFHERARRGRYRGTTGSEVEMEAGVAPRLEFRVGQGGAYGNLETRRRLDAAGEEAGERQVWGGTTRVGALYQLGSGRGAWPAIGLLGRVQTIYGPGRPSYEAEAIALIGKTLRRGRGGLPLGMHLNLGLVNRFDPLPEERANRLFFNLSVGQAVTRDTAVVLSYAQEQQERGQGDYRLVQAGLRHRLAGSGTVLGLAFGTGLGRDSPRFQLAFAVGFSLATGGW